MFEQILAHNIRFEWFFLSLSRGLSSSEFSAKLNLMILLISRHYIVSNKGRHLKGCLRHIDASGASERSREKKRSRFSSSENKRTSRRGAARRKEARGIANGAVCFGYSIGGQDFQERIINFPCHSGGPCQPLPIRPTQIPRTTTTILLAISFDSARAPPSLLLRPDPHGERGDFANKQPEPIPPSPPLPSAVPRRGAAFLLFEAHTDPSISAPVIKHNRSTFGIRYIYVMELSLVSVRTTARRNAEGRVCVGVCIGIRTISWPPVTRLESVNWINVRWTPGSSFDVSHLPLPSLSPPFLLSLFPHPSASLLPFLPPRLSHPLPIPCLISARVLILDSLGKQSFVL